MGVFDFIRDAGKALFGAGEANAAEAIEKEVKDLGLEGDVKVAVDGDTVKLEGSAPSQEAREKLILATGNIAGIAKVEDAVEAPSEPEAQFHTVEKGDTLWAISKTYYGDGAKYPTIFEANKPMLDDPDKIYPGQKLRIPPLT